MTTTTNDQIPDTPAELVETLQPAPNVIVALSRVMAELPNIGRDMQSEQGYSYRGIEQITRHAQPLFAKHGIVLAPQATRWLPVTNLTINNRPWTDEKLIVTYRCYGPGGPEDYIEIEVPGIGRDNSDKGSNKAMTQAYKYALIQALCIADGKDDADREQAHEADAHDEGLDVNALVKEIRRLTGVLRERGIEVSETNDENETTVLGVKLSQRNEDGALIRVVTGEQAAALITILSAKVTALADALIEAGESTPEPEPPPERAQTPEQAERERVARDQLMAVGGGEKRTRAKKAEPEPEPAPEQ